MTLSQLYRKALEKLQVVAAGEDAEPDDVQLIASKYDSVYAMLQGLKLVSWARSGELPNEAAEPLIMMLAFASADEFGADPAEFATGAIGLERPALAERQLRTQMAREYVSHPAESEYF